MNKAATETLWVVISGAFLLSGAYLFETLAQRNSATPTWGQRVQKLWTKGG